MSNEMKNAIIAWFNTHAMAPAFQVSEFAKETGLKYVLNENTVSFTNPNQSVHVFAVALDGKSLNLNDFSVVEEVEQEDEEVLTVQPLDTNEN